MRRAFTLLEVLIAALILGVGLATILASISQSQRMMLVSNESEAAQEVMDWGEMAYPLEDVQDPEHDLEVTETKATELWEMISDKSLTGEQYDKFRSYTWEREWVNQHDNDDDIKRIGNLYVVRITVRWGDRHVGEEQSESYITYYRKKE